MKGKGFNRQFLVAGMAAAACTTAYAAAPEGRLNVLFIMADDMRPELGCYGVKEIKTPNIDRLASEGVVFRNAYCNVPVSGASRASLLTGMYPSYPDRFTDFSAKASVDCPEAVPVSEWFTSHGYHTVSDGKVFHHTSGRIRCVLGRIQQVGTLDERVVLPLHQPQERERTFL